MYAKCIALAEAGKSDEAIKTLLAARDALFNAPTGDAVHIAKGLSFKIALALAERYENKEDAAHLKREISFMKVGRPWMAKEQEHDVFMHYAIKEVFDVWLTEEKKTGKRMKTKERKRLHHILQYMVVGNADIIYEEGYKLRKKWEDAAAAAKKTYATVAWDDFGAEGDIQAHDDPMAASNFEPGEVVLVINRKVTSVTKKAVIFDFTEQRLVPVDCKNTGKVLRVTSRGRFVYKQQCRFVAREGG